MSVKESKLEQASVTPSVPADLLPNEIKEAAEVIDKMDPAEKEAMNVMMSYYSGPLPPASELTAYNKIDPKAKIADRIVKMSEKQLDANIECTKKAQAIQARDSLLGSIFSLVVCLATLAIGAVLVYFDKNVAGYGTLVTGIAVILKLFMSKSGVNKEEDDSIDKN